MTERFSIPNIEHLESMLHQAVKEDIPGIMDVQQSRSLEKMIADGMDKDAIEKSGFLVHLLTEPELEALIDEPEGSRILVCKEGDLITGYALGYTLKQWKKEHPEWLDHVTFKEGVPADTVADDLTIYFRHIAILPTAKTGTGTKLCRTLIEQSQREGFQKTIGEILKAPYVNQRSVLVHTAMGFEEIGEVHEQNNKGEEYTWGLFMKESREKVKKGPR